MLSKPRKVRSGVHQGSILGPLLFVLFINGLPSHLNTPSAHFADDVKIWGPSDDPRGLQGNLDRIFQWACENGMSLNPSKSRVISVKSRTNFTYTINGGTIPTSAQEKDLGTVICSNLSVSPNAKMLALRTGRSLSMLLRSRGRFEKSSFPKLYASYVQAHLELNIQANPPVLQKDIRLLESVQRRATKRVKGLTTKCYTDRLRELNMYSLAFRRLRGDMILTYQILNNPSHPNREFLKLRESTSLRGHRLTLQKPLVRTRTRSAAFSSRVPFTWNRLPADVVNAPTLETFKKRFDIYAKSQGKVFTTRSYYEGKEQVGDPWAAP